MNTVIKGLGVSEGLGIGTLLVVKPEVIPTKKTHTGYNT